MAPTRHETTATTMSSGPREQPRLLRLRDEQWAGSRGKSCNGSRTELLRAARAADRSPNYSETLHFSQKSMDPRLDSSLDPHTGHEPGRSSCQNHR